MPNPNGNPNWAIGKSANPLGRPPKPLPSHLELARKNADKAIITLVRMMEESDDWAQRGWAAERILDRAYGKALQQTEITANGDISVVVKMLLNQPAIQDSSNTVELLPTSTDAGD
jgi:hypothetical protein